MKGAPVTEIDLASEGATTIPAPEGDTTPPLRRNPPRNTGSWKDPEDPEDTPLLRFDVCRFVDGEWEYVEDSSYCAMVPCDTPRERLLELLRVILDDVADDVRAGISIKKKCEHLSWITA